MPTGSVKIEEIVGIYEKVDGILQIVNNKGNIIMMADFNAVVTEAQYKVGKFGLGQINKKEERIIEICQQYI